LNSGFAACPFGAVQKLHGPNVWAYYMASRRRHRIGAIIDGAYRRAKTNRRGHVATYIPQLAKADPDLFGVCFVTCEGEVYKAGQSSETVPIESISKVFSAAMAADELGTDVLDAKIGNMGSSLPFNSIIGAVLTPTHTINPFVNQGAIATTSLFYRKDKKAFRDKVLSNMNRYAGRELGFNAPVYESEGATNSKNMALAYLLKSFDRFYGNVEDTVDVYTSQCSVNVSAEDLATMACVFAKGGVHPHSGERIISPEAATYVYRALRGEGLYESSAKWNTDVGAVSAKSGVGGGIFIVIKGVGGIGLVSPRLDKVGNSVRGMQAGAAIAKQLTTLFDAREKFCATTRRSARDRRRTKTRRNV